MAYGGFWRRLVAVLIDCIILGVVALIIYLALGVGVGGDEATQNSEDSILYEIYELMFWLIHFLYFVLQDSGESQGTIGKNLMGMKIYNGNGERISIARAALRYFAQIVSGLTLFLGYLMAAFTERKQGLHDMIAGTYVIKN